MKKVMRGKKAMGPPSWDMLGSKVMTARVDAHALRQVLAKAYKALEALSPEEKDVVYKHIGDLISDVPEKLKAIESSLDMLNYALAHYGKTILKDRLSLDQRSEVESSFEPSPDLIAVKMARKYVEKKGL